MTALRPPAPPAPDAIEDVQIRGVARWSPRRTGVPALLDWWPAYFLLATLALLAVLVTARLLVDVLRPFAHVIVVAGVATVLTVALAPVVGRLDRHMPRPVAAAIVFLATVLVIVGIAGAVVAQLATEGDRFSRQLEEANESLQGRRPLALGPYVLPSGVQAAVRDLVTTQGPAIAERTAALAMGVASSLVDLVLILVVTFYLLVDARRFRLIALRSLDPAKRPAARRVLLQVVRVFGGYVRAQLMVALSLGVLVAIAMFALGVPYALSIALFAAVIELIPMVGPFLGAVPALLVALTMPFPAVLWVALAFLVIQQIESNVLLPRLSAHAVGIHPIGSILALVLGFEIGGVVGALFAVPIAGLLWVLFSTAVNAWRDRRQELHTSGERAARPAERPGSRARRPVRDLRPR